MVDTAKDSGIVRVVRDAGRTGSSPGHDGVSATGADVRDRQARNVNVQQNNYPGSYANYGGNYPGGMFGDANPFPQQDDVGEIFRKLWRRKWLILSTIILSLVLAVAIMSLLPRKYSGHASLFIESGNDAVMGSTPLPQAQNNKDEVYIVSQTDIIRSRGFAEGIISQLNLHQMPEFNRKLATDSMLDTAWKFVVEKSGGEGETDGLPGAVGINRVPAAVIDKFMEKTYVTHKNETRIIEIHFTSKDPQLARDVPNALAAMYIQWQREQRFNRESNRGRTLAPQITALEDEVRSGEAEIVRLSQRIGGLPGANGGSSGQQLTELTTRLLEQEANVAEAVSRRDNARGANSLELAQSPLVERLRGELASLRQRKADLASEYGAKHPVMQQLAAQMSDIEVQIQTEGEKITRSLENQVRVERTKLASFRSARDKIEAKISKGSAELPILQSLERKLEADRSLLAEMRKQYQVSLLIAKDQKMLESDTKVVSAAAVPEKASSPKPGLILPVVLMASLILGLIFAFLREKLEPGYLSGQQIEKEFGVPVLALVPATSKFLGGEPDVLQELRSPFTESMRTVGTSIRLFDIDNPPKTVLMTSAEPSEGKSTIAISVARVQALAGLKVIIVDTDIRKPVVHERLSVRRAPGLVEVLDGKHTLEEAIVSDEKTGVDVLPVGVPVSTDTLAFDRMRDFLNELKEYYDLIIIDSAPILAVSDARILPAIADMTVFTVRWRETRREVVKLAVKLLQESGARLGGVILSRVNVKSHSRYGYGDSVLYTGKLKKYYTQA